MGRDLTPPLNKDTESRSAWGVSLFTGALVSGSIALAVWSILRLEEFFGPPGLGDLKRMWAAVGVFAAGGIPYDNRAVDAYAVVAGAGPILDLPVYVPPFGFGYLLPLASMPFAEARGAYLFAAILIGIVITIWWPAQRALSGDPQVGGLGIAAGLTFFPGMLMWWVGPLSLWPLAGILSFVVLGGRARRIARFCGGFLLVATLVKPNCAPFVLPFVGGFFVRERRWVEIAAVLTGVIFTCGVGIELLIDSTWWLRVGETGLWRTSAPLRALDWSMLPLAVRFFPVVSLGLCAVWFGYTTRSLESLLQRLVLVVIPLGLCFTPFAWTYDFTPLLLTIGGLTRVGKGGESVGSRSIWLLGGVVVLNIALCLSPLAMELHWWYPLGFAALGMLGYLGCYESRPDRAT